MAAREIYHNRIELLQGTLDLLVLETLKWGAQQWVRHQPADF
jgi:PadR family transcriptional regulator PadR